MSHVRRRARLLAVCLPLVFGAAAPLPMHRAPHPPSVSNLPPPHLIGDPATRLNRTYQGTPIDVTSYHYDLARTGWNQSETDLTPATVASANFGNIATLTVDGNVLAQPLLVSGFTMPDHLQHDVLIIATGHNSVYAFDAQTYAVLWQVSLGTPQSSADVGCGDVQPEYGISATPIILRSGPNAARIFVIAASEPTPNNFVTQLHALDLATGADAIPPVVVAPSATLSDGSTVKYDPKNQWTRASLAYNPHNSSIYVPVGSHCDNNRGGITGWLLRYNTKLVLQHAFHTVDTAGGTELASIWMTGFAPSIDSDGDVYVVTGNGDYTHRAQDWGESVLKLNPLLTHVTGSFTASNYDQMNTQDQDFGSGGVMLLPPVDGQSAPPMAVAMGKPSILYLLNQNKLGGEHTGDTGALQWQKGGGRGLWGGPAYYNGPAGPTVFIQAGDDVLRSWSLNTGSTPSLTLGVTSTSHAGYGGSLPIVSSNGATANTGVVWLIDRTYEPFTIQAYDAVALGAPIFSAQVGTWSNTGQGNPFLTPMEANGRVYAPGYKLVQVYGLIP